MGFDTIEINQVFPIFLGIISGGGNFRYQDWFVRNRYRGYPGRPSSLPDTDVRNDSNPQNDFDGLGK